MVISLQFTLKQLSKKHITTLIVAFMVFFNVNNSFAGSPPCATLPIVEDPTLVTDQNEHPCHDNVPVFVVDLRGTADSLWDTRDFVGIDMDDPSIGGIDILDINNPVDGPGVRRHGDKNAPCETCCNANTQNNDNESCLGIILYLDSAAGGMALDIVSGSTPGSGILGYRFSNPTNSPADCSAEYPADGSEICLTGSGPFYLSFCKPGANPNHFTIRSIPDPEISPTDVVSEACSGKVWGTGYDPNSIQWTALIPAGPDSATIADSVATWLFDEFGNPTNGALIDTLFVELPLSIALNPPTWLPDSVIFQICGEPLGGCDNITICDTTMIRFVSNLEVLVTPKDPAICFGSSFVTLFAEGQNGDPPYTYNWYKDGNDSIPIYTGIDLDDSIDVYGTGAGEYRVEVLDQQGCSSNQDTSTVIVYPSPIAIDVGNDTSACANDSCVQLAASVEIAGGIIWLDAPLTGTFSVNDSTDSIGTLNTTYCPSAAEVTAGSVTLIARTTDNRGCDAVADTLIITYSPEPIVDAGPPSDTVCANDLTVQLAGTYSNTTGAIWSGGTGMFSTLAQDSIAQYTLSPGDTVGGSLMLYWTSTGGSTLCNPAVDSIEIIVIPSPIVSAGPDDTTCNNNYNVILAATSSTGSGQWSNMNGDHSGFTDRILATTMYTPTTTDSSTGSATLIWESTNNGLYCTLEADTMVLIINTAATATAPEDFNVCFNNPDFSLTGTTTPTGQSVFWTTNMPGSWQSNDSSSYTVTYNPAGMTSNTTYDVAFCVPNPGVGCIQECDSLLVTVTPEPLVDACDGCGPLDYSLLCAGNCLANLNGAFTNQGDFPGSGTEWNVVVNGASVNDVNAVITDITDLTSQYCPGSEETPSFPTQLQQVSLILTPTNVGNCLVVPDTANITIVTLPTVEAGVDQQICENNPSDLVMNADSNYGITSEIQEPIWTISPAAGTFTDVTGIIDETLSFTSTPTLTDTFTLEICIYRLALFDACPVVCDSMQVTVLPSPTATVGIDQIVCSNNPDVTFTGDTTSGGAGGALSFQWTNIYGTQGSFGSSNALSTTYSPDASQIAVAAGQALPIPPADSTWCAEFRVSDVSTFCSSVADTVCVSATPAPLVDAGPSDTVCDNNRPVTLNGSVGDGASSGIWSGGTGIFLPNSTTLTGVGYTPTTTDSVTLNLCSTDGAALNNCLEVCDSMKIYVTPAPTVNAGLDDTSCVNNPNVTLAGSYDPGVSGGVVWRNFSGSFAPLVDSTNEAGLYQPNATEYGVGGTTMSLILSTTNSGLCLEIQDTMNIYFEPSPIVDAGNTIDVCTNNPCGIVTGSVANATGTTWTTNRPADVTIVDPDSLSTSVCWTNGQPTPGDSVRMYLTSTGNGNCNAVLDSTTIYYTPSPTIFAGPADTSCSNNTQLCLASSMTLSTTMIWSNFDVAGSFIGGSSTSDTVCYTPTATEITNGFVEFIATTTDTGNCLAVADTVRLEILQAPIISTTVADSICTDALPMALNASLTTDPRDGITYGFSWVGNNPGDVFSPNNDTISTFNPDPTTLDTIPVEYFVKINTTGGAYCNDVSATDSFIVMPTPTVNAGGDVTVCTDATTIPLSPTSTHINEGTWSLGSGANGTFTGNQYNIDIANDTIGAGLGGSIYLVYCGTDPIFSGCGIYCDSIQITFQGAPTAIVSAPNTICTNDYPVTISASGSGIGAWTTIQGVQSIVDANAQVTDIVPSAANETDGFVEVTWCTSAIGSCPSFCDQDTISILPGPIVFAGNDTTLCSDIACIDLNGSITNAGGTGYWNVLLGQVVGSFDFGFGTVTPNRYCMSNDNYTDGTVSLVLCNNNQTFCPQECDTMVVTLTPNVVIDAGIDRTICADQDTLQLFGNVTTATGGTWTTTSGCNGPSGAFDNANILTPVYTWCAGDIAVPGTTDSVKVYVTSTGNGLCAPTTDSMTITITPAPTIDAGPDDTICYDEGVYGLNGTITIASQGVWTTNSVSAPPVFDAGGVFTSPTGLINYYPTSVDSNLTLEMYLNTTGAGQCNNIADTMLLTILPTPVVTVPADTTLCADAGSFTINGATMQNSTTGIWTENGPGSFMAGTETNLNGAIYQFSGNDTNNIVVFKWVTTDNGTCNPDSGTFTLTITPSVIVRAGPDQALCATGDSILLAGTVQYAGGGTWSTLPTGGTFVDDIDLATDYIRSATDSTSGFATVILTSRLEGQCVPQTDTMLISFQAVPVALAGPDDTVCADTSGYNLLGSVVNATGGYWTSSNDSGFFMPSDTHTLFVPSASDTMQINQPLTLCIQTTGNGLCALVSDCMDLTITPIPVITAPAFDTVCADIDTVNFSALVQFATGLVWTTNGHGTMVDSSQNNLEYILDPQDTLIGDIRFFVTSTGNGLCNAYSEQLDLNISPAPGMEAGPDQTICRDDADIVLTGSVNYGNGIWTSDDISGVFADSSDLGTTYTHNTVSPTTPDTIKLTLTNINVGACKEIQDSVQLIVTPIPIMDAGGFDTICADSGFLQLSGTFANAGGGVWSSPTGGTFSPDSISINSTYHFDSLDYVNGSVTLDWTSTDFGTCNPVTDQLVITINPAPTVYAGPDQRICADAPATTLAGTMTVAGNSIWTTAGQGTIALPNSLTSDFTADSAGIIVLTLTTLDNGLCNAVSDIVNITVDPAPSITAGPDQTVCKTDNSVTMAGSITNATGIIWRALGTGSWQANDSTSIASVYVPSTLDTAVGTIQVIASTTDSLTGCAILSDTMSIIFSPLPTVNAGSATACFDAAGIELIAIRTNANGVLWSTNGTGAGSEFTTTAADTTYFTPNIADVPGNIEVYVQTVGSGGCADVFDTIQVQIRPDPIVEAGPTQIVCIDENTIIVGIDSDTTNYTGQMEWISSGGGPFADSSATPTTYTISAVDAVSDSALIYWCTANNGLCPTVCDSFIAYITPAPEVYAGANITRCADEDTVCLAGDTVNSVPGGVAWTTNGDGTFVDSSALDPCYVPGIGDDTVGTVLLTVATINNGRCQTYTDDRTLIITPVPTFDLPPADTYCADIGSYIVSASNLTVATSGHWTYSGVPDSVNSSYGDSSITFQTYFSQADRDTANLEYIFCADIGNGRCQVYCDTFNLTLTPSPTLDIGDSALCASDDSVQLSANYTIAGGIEWSTKGDGTFSDSLADTTYYYFGTNDKTTQSVLVIAETRDAGTCTIIYDTIVINYTDPFMLTAGPDQVVCSDTGTITLNAGHNTAVTSVLWTTTGNGNFVNPITEPFAVNDTAASYTLTQDDIDSSGVQLILTTTVGSLCPEIADTMNVSIYLAPVVSASATNACASPGNAVNLIGSIDTNGVTGHTGTWTTAGGGMFDGNTVPASTILPNTDYTPAGVDITTETFLLTLTADPYRQCKGYFDTLRVNLIPVPTVTTVDTVICKDADDITLRAYTFSDTTTRVTWSGGNGTFSVGDIGVGIDSIYKSDSTFMTYTFDPADTTGIDSLILYVTNAGGSCSPVTDSIVIRFNPVPTVFATPAAQCAVFDTLSLVGTITNAGGGTWSHSGSGSFAFGNTVLINEYQPVPADTVGTADSVVIKLCTRLNAGCKTYCDSSTIYFSPPPVIFAGNDTTVCADVLSIPLMSVSVDTTASAGAVWTNSIGGTFTPNDSVIFNPIFNVPDTIRTGGVDTTATLILTTYGSGFCPEISDTMEITITHPPIVTSADTITVCADTSAIPISIITNDVPDSVFWEIISGAGHITDVNADTTTYNFVQDDIDSGYAIVRYSSYDFAGCVPVVDTIYLEITPIPTVDITVDEICIDNPVVTLTSLVTHDGSSTPDDAVWTSSTQGTGGFTDGSGNTDFYTLDSASGDTALATVKLFLTTTNNGLCQAYVDSVILNIIPAPFANAGPNQGICGDQNTVCLNAVVTTDSIRWSSSGTGTFVDSLSDTTCYTLSSADSANGVVLTITTTFDNRGCNPGVDSVIVAITNPPIVNAGIPDTACYEQAPGVPGFISLSGSIDFDIAGAGVFWSGGTGTFVSLSSPGLGNTDTIVEYYFDQVDSCGDLRLYITSTGTGNCNAVTDSVDVFVRCVPTVTDNADTTVCADIDSVQVSVLVQNATGVSWTTSGQGMFRDTSLFTTHYIPDPQDIADSLIVLTPSTTGTEECLTYSESFNMYFTDAPTVDAGLPQNVCSCNGDSIFLTTANTTIANAFAWTSDGAGTFVDSSVLNATYVPACPGDSSITINMILTASDTVTGCKTYIDTVQITFEPAVVVSAGGPTDTVCADIGTIQLNGSVLVATGGLWSTLNGDPNQFNPIPPAQDLVMYTLTDADTARGTVTFVLESTGGGNCLTIYDTIEVIITPIPVVTGGFDDTICADAVIYGLTGGVTVTGTGAWTSSGDGTWAPDSLTLITDYILGTIDGTVLSGTTNLINFVLVSTNNGHCNPVQDVVQLTVTEVPIVFAGNDRSICQDKTSISFVSPIKDSYIIGATSSGNWTSDGDGTFVDALGAIDTSFSGMIEYDLGPDDLLRGDTSGFITFVLESTNNGSCNPVLDTMMVQILPRPTVTVDSTLNLLNDTLTICADQDTVSFIGTVTNSPTQLWSATSPGVCAQCGFSRTDATALNPLYTIDSTDINVTDLITDYVGITLETIGNSNGCDEVNDALILEITPRPRIAITAPDTVCADVGPINVEGSVLIATGGIWTSSDLTGSFGNVTNLVTTYTLGTDDIGFGLATLVLESTGHGQCNQVFETHNIVVTPRPAIDAGPDMVICGDFGNFTISADSVNDIVKAVQWSTIEGNNANFSNRFALHPTYTLDPSDIPDPTSKTSNFLTFILESTNVGDCQNILDTMIVEIKPTPIVTLSAGDICADLNGLEVNATYCNATGIIWSSNDGIFGNVADTSTQFTPDASVKPGTAIVTVCSDGNGVCQAVCDSIGIIITDLPNPDAGPSQLICRHAGTQLNGIDSLGTGDVLTWYDENGLVLTTGASHSVNTVPNPTFFAFGILDVNGCERIDTMYVEVIDPPTLDMDSLYCFDDNLSISAGVDVNTIPDPPFQGTWQWYYEGAPAPGLSTDTVYQVIQSGVHSVQWLSGSCFISDTTLVAPRPIVEGIDVSICEFGAYNLEATTGFITYAWAEVGGLGQTGNGNPFNASGIGNDSIDQVFIVTITDSLGCQNDDSVYLYELNPPTLDVFPDTTCDGFAVDLYGVPQNDTVLGNTDSAIYTWTYGGNILKQDSTWSGFLAPDSAHKWTSRLDSGWYKLTYGIEQCIVTDSAYLPFHALPETFAQDSAVFCAESDVFVTLDGGTSSGSPTGHIWYDEDKAELGITSQFIDVTVEMTYYVTIIDSNGCMAEDSVFVEERCPPRCHLPTAFSPDGTACDPTCSEDDNIICNDNCFYVFCKHQKDFKLTIFNRWGEIIFYSENKNNVWDGTYLGKDMPSGLYPWTMEYNALEEEYDRPKYVSGKILIIR